MSEERSLKEKVKAQVSSMKTKEELKSELDHVKDLFQSYSQIKSIDARRMIIEDMLRLYRAEHCLYVDNAMNIFESVNMPKAVYNYLRPEIKLNWPKKILRWFI